MFDVKWSADSIQPGVEAEMEKKPVYDDEGFAGFGRLAGKTAIITGGDSGIGRAVAIAYAKEGANLLISYKGGEETEDAEKVRKEVEKHGVEVELFPGDIGDSSVSAALVQRAVDRFGTVDILVNNAGEQSPQDKIEDISDEQLERTFRTNIFSMFYLVRAAVPHMKAGASIINTSSITAFVGNQQLLDYSATKGAITSFTKSLALSLADRGIRVNSVAPGPIWTPLITSTFGDVENFGADTPLHRGGQPLELAEAYVFLAWDRAASYINGQTIHVNGGNYLSG